MTANFSRSQLMVILGAGASYDCADRETAAEINDDFRPPLVKEIFARNFDGILSRYPAVTARMDELRTLLSKSHNFDKIFRTLLESAARHKKLWPFQIPLYLRELFWTISLDYFRGGSKFDTLVRRVLESSFEQVVFVNLNYDLFLDQALSHYDHHEFEALESYVPEAKRWRNVKLHGSVNWARILENCPADSTGWFYPSSLEAPPILSSELRVIMWNRHSQDFYIPGGGPPGYLYPQIVVPTDTSKSFACPQHHADLAMAFAQTCRYFLLIGFSGHDEDVVDLLQNAPSQSRWAIVSRGDSLVIHERINSRMDKKRSRKIVTHHDMGFSKFVSHQDFDRFLGEEPF